MTTLPIETSDGVFLAHYSDAGLAALGFPASRAGARPKPAAPAVKVSASLRAWHRLTERAVNAALGGRAPAALPPLDLSAGTDFQRRVWAELRKIETGATRSYGDIAAAVGNPRAVRAVGGACGANPIPLLIPCHRVLAADGRIGGFSGGLDRKRELLRREGVAVAG